MYRTVLSQKNLQIYFFLILMPFIPLSCMIALVRISNIVLKEVVRVGIVLFLNLEEIFSAFHC